VEEGSRVARVCIVRLSRFPGDPRVEREVGALIDAGFRVDLVCLKRAGQKSIEPVAGALVYRLPASHRRAGRLRYMFEYALSFIMAFVTVSALHIVKRYQVVQVNTLPDFLAFVALVPKLLGARVLLDMHEVTPELYASKFRLPMESFQVKLMARVERLSTGFADSVLCVSEPTREVLVQRGTPAKKIGVVMNLADSRLFHPLPPVLPIGRNHSSRFRLMCHGTIVERYGFQEAIQATALVGDQIPGLRLCILGEGEYLPYLQQLASRLGVNDRIDFCGYVPLSEIPSRISCCHAGLVPNLRDGFTDLVLPTKLMEYVAMGKPVIASRTRAIERYFDGSMVLFFEPGRAEELAQRILDLYRREDMGVDLARNAQRFLQTYRWEATKETYVGIVRHLANGDSK